MLSERFSVHWDSLRTVPWVEIFSLSFWWFLHWLGRQSEISRSGATFFSSGSCEELRREEQKLTWCEADPEERSLTWQDSCTQVKQQDQFPSDDSSSFRGFLSKLFGGFDHLQKNEWQKRTWFRQRCSLGSRNRTEIGDSGEDKRFEEGGYGDTLWVLRETLLLLLHIWIFLLY